jgi:cell division protein FtsX
MPDILLNTETMIRAAFFLAGLFVGAYGVLTAWALARMAADRTGVRERSTDQPDPDHSQTVVGNPWN